MAQINDLLVLGNSNLLGSVNVLGDLTKNGDGVITITALNTALANISYSSILNAPSALQNPNKLIFTGASTEEYDGSTEISIHLVGWKGAYGNAEVFNDTSNKALGYYSHAQGWNTTASGAAASAEGCGTVASGNYSHAQGYDTIAKANHTVAQGYNTVAAKHAAFAFGEATQAGGSRSTAGGYNAFAVGENSFAFGTGSGTHATVSMKAVSNSNQLLVTTIPEALVVGSVIEYDGVYALVTSVNADSLKVTIGTGTSSGLFATNPFPNTTSYQTANIYNGIVAGGMSAFATGNNSIAMGNASFATGGGCVADGVNAFAEGAGTIASGSNHHAQGAFNIKNTGITLLNAKGNLVHIIGNGTADDARSNAHTLAWDGTAWFQGDVYVGSTSGTNKDSGSVRLAKITEVPTGAAASKGVDASISATTTSTNLPTSQAVATLVGGRLEKTTYEKSAELACGSNGKVCLGKFGVYDSNVTIELNCTTSTSYHATIVLYTQNIYANQSGGTIGCHVYEDANNAITPLLTIFRPNTGSTDRFVEVYADLPGWSKNLVHVQGVALSDGGMQDVLTTVDTIPTAITGKTLVTPVNILTDNFASKSHGTHVTYGTSAAALGTSSAGTSDSVSRSDHVHAMPTAANVGAIAKPSSTTVNTIARYSSTTGDVKASGILIEDVTNTRDTSKKAHVLSIPAEGGKKMVYGYCTDQVDGTSFIGGVFDANATAFPYSAGLAIGGSSGNLLWKAKRVLTTDDGWDAGNVNRHIYLTGSKASSSTGNTSQIVFGTSADEHVALSSNTAMLVINPNTASASNQILLKLATYSTFPKGIKVTTESGLTPSESLLRNSKLVSTTTNPSMNGEICWQYE